MDRVYLRYTFEQTNRFFLLLIRALRKRGFVILIFITSTLLNQTDFHHLCQKLNRLINGINLRN